MQLLLAARHSRRKLLSPVTYRGTLSLQSRAGWSPDRAQSHAETGRSCACCRRSPVPRAQAMPLGAPSDRTKLFPTPAPALRQTCPKNTCSPPLLMRCLWRARCRSTRGPPPPLQKHSWATTIPRAGPTPTPRSHGRLDQESHSLRWSWSKKTGCHRRGDSHTEALMHAEHLLPGEVPHGHLACQGATRRPHGPQGAEDAATMRRCPPCTPGMPVPQPARA